MACLQPPACSVASLHLGQFHACVLRMTVAAEIANGVCTATGLTQRYLFRSWKTGDGEWQGQVRSIVCEPAGQPINFQVSTVVRHISYMGPVRS